MTMLSEDEIKRRIEKALKFGGNTHSFEDIIAGLHSGKFQIFWNDRAVCITEICVCPQVQYLFCFIFAGEMEGLKELEARVEDFAREQNCAFMLSSSRLGFLKVLPQMGWKKTSVVFTKPVTPKEHSNG